MSLFLRCFRSLQGTGFRAYIGALGYIRVSKEPDHSGSKRVRNIGASCDIIASRQGTLPIVSFVVPFFGLTKSILRILKGSPKKELQWRV